MKLSRLIRSGAVLLTISTISVAASADILELKDGSVVEGRYKGGTQGTLRFQTEGELKVYAVKDVIALTFTGEAPSSSSPAAVAPSAASGSASAPGKKGTTVPAGTVVLVRMLQEVGTHNMSAGDRFSAELEADLMSGSDRVLPAGTVVYGEVLKSRKGGVGARKAELDLILTQIKIDGQLKPIRSAVLRGEGQTGGLGRKILKGAAAGALADGSDGAETGARIGAGAGIIGGGKHAGIRRGSLVEFILDDPLSL